MKKTIIPAALVALASVFLVLGCYNLFSGIDQNGVDNSSSYFSVTGVLLIGAALLYQVREYRLQIEELKKSVEAQTKMAEAMDEQKLLLYEQNTNSQIFAMISGFRAYADRVEVRDSINVFFSKYTKLFHSELMSLSPTAEGKDVSVDFARKVKAVINAHKADDQFPTTRRFVQFVYNILYLIGQKKFKDEKDVFTPFLMNHLSSNEGILICLFNLIDYGGPLSDRVRWYNQLTEEFISLVSIKDSQLLNVVNSVKLTEEFNRIKQFKD